MMVAFRAEVVIAKWLEKALKQELKWLSNDNVLKRGSTPTVVEWLILGWVVGKSGGQCQNLSNFCLQSVENSIVQGGRHSPTTGH